DYIYMAGYVNDTTTTNVTDIVLSSVEPTLLTHVKTTREIFAFRLYPNPAIDVVTINTDFQGVFSVDIHDMSGRSMMVTSEIFDMSIVDVSSLRSGMYEIRVKTSSESYIRMFQKM